MIVTVTLNPSIDRTASLPGPLQRGQVNRLGNSTEVSAGKGVNISRVLCGAGVDTCAVIPAGTKDRLVTGLANDKIPHVAVPISASARTNLTITEPDGTTTKINQPGAALTPDELTAVEEIILETSTDAEWVVLSGSLPPGVPSNWYTTMTRRLHETGVKVAVDTSDKPLQELSGKLPPSQLPNSSSPTPSSSVSSVESTAAPWRLPPSKAISTTSSLPPGACTASPRCWSPSAARGPYSSPRPMPGTPGRNQSR